jgi:hypothetical protein
MERCELPAAMPAPGLPFRGKLAAGDMRLYVLQNMSIDKSPLNNGQPGT